MRLAPLFFLITIPCFVLICLFVIVARHKIPDFPVCCKNLRAASDVRWDDARRLDDVHLATIIPSTKKINIFFVKNTCGQENTEIVPETHNLLNLMPHEACAIESAALHNPSTNIFVLFVTPTYVDKKRLSPSVQALFSYSNVHLRNVNLLTYVKDSPVDWLKNGAIFRLPFLAKHFDEFLCYLSLWRYGGICLDTGVLVMQNLVLKRPNYVGAVSPWEVGAAVLNLRHSGVGKQFAKACLRQLAHGFYFMRPPISRFPSKRNSGVMTATVRLLCSPAKVTFKNKLVCSEFRVYQKERFYEIGYAERDRLFEEQHANDTLNRLKNKRIVYTWKKSGEVTKSNHSSKVAYAMLAENHCPNAYIANDGHF